MKMPLRSSGELLDHSEAKVRLLESYLTNYLAVVTNIAYVKSVDLYDLFCGPGRYGESSEGSPLIALKVANQTARTLQSKGLPIPRINLFFADDDPGNIRIAKSECERLHDQTLGTLEVVPRDYATSLKSLLSKPFDKSRKEFVFVDPTGYSEVRPYDIKRLIGRQAEALLFLPVQFMYRFRSSATPEPLQDFVGELKGAERLSNAKDVHAYALELRHLFRALMGPTVFVSTFMIEKDASTLFCLYFFTTKWQGHVKMIEAKWKVGADAGQGWSFRTVPGQTSLIGPEDLMESHVLELLSERPRTNLEMFEIGVLDLEFPPSVVNQTCVKLARRGAIRIKGLETGTKNGYCYVGEKTYRNKETKVELSIA